MRTRQRQRGGLFGIGSNKRVGWSNRIGGRQSGVAGNSKSATASPVESTEARQGKAVASGYARLKSRGKEQLHGR